MNANVINATIDNINEKIVVNRCSRQVYENLNYNYKTRTGNYPIKDAFREALKKFSEFYYKSKSGYHLHHVEIPFDAIARAWWCIHFKNQNFAPVYYCASAKRYFLPDDEAELFATFHDNIIELNNSSMVLIPKKEHAKLHGEWKINNQEKKLIDEWTEKIIYQFVSNDFSMS